MDFLRSFLVTRPTKSRLKQTGILKERVFGCDLGEYLHNCGDDGKFFMNLLGVKMCNRRTKSPLQITKLPTPPPVDNCLVWKPAL